ncbi:hypothetical protein MBGDF03_00959 [Thermoplasmatales archaeon SCGC AB-540-F20]|nr:hypothetical protein MBGDF03_00959 [Thermoplasmatales archaeon SCGC AB-540-F20]
MVLQLVQQYNVKEGTYNEIVHIYKKINLTGENREKTFINFESKKNGYSC